MMATWRCVIANLVHCSSRDYNGRSAALLDPVNQYSN